MDVRGILVKIMKSKVTIVAVTLGVPLLFTFQNCSSTFQPITNQVAAGSSYCVTNPTDPACLNPLPVQCHFNGQVLASGQTVEAFLNSTTPYGQACVKETRSCQNGILSGSYSFSNCTVEQPAACLFNGITIQHGQNVNAFLNSSVAFGGTCQNETRSCINGSLSGTYNYATCTANAPAACSFNGHTIAHGQGVTAYTSSNVPYGATCTPQTRTCYNGAFTGVGEFGSCVVDQGAACLFNGQTLANGQSVTAFTAPSVSFGGACQAQTRICTNGSLSGDAAYASCSVGSPQSCLINGQTIPHGSSTTLYTRIVVGATESCQAEARTCHNGALSGSATENSCFVTPYAIANPHGLNKWISSNPGYLDYVIQDVCTDAYGNIVHGDPAYCSTKRNVRIGERVPYIVTDMERTTGVRYQGLFSYPTLGTDGLIKIMVSKNMQGPFNSSFSYRFNDNHDGYDMLDVDGGAVSGIRTSDPGCFDQIISNTSQRRHGWIFFGVNLDSSSSNHSIRIDRISPSLPSNCERVSQDTSGSVRDIWNSPTPVGYESGKVLNSIVTYHFAHYNLAQQNNALEKYFFTREYGFTRWEAWIPRNRCYAEGKWYCNDPSAYIGGRCAGSGTTEFGGQIWVRIDCRDSTGYIDLVNPVLPLTDVMGRSNGVVDIDYSGTVNY